jgi:3-phosphoshikimate 1-carboxyvinyltransferase
MPNKPILLKNLFLNSIQGDEAMVNFFEKLGTETSQLTNGVLLRNNKNSLNELAFNLQNCLDLAPALCVSCAVLNVKAHITGLQNLVIKESNRLLAICNELNKLGFKLSYSADSIVVNPSYDIDYEAIVTINSYQDHRIIMAFAPLALLFKNICIDEISSVSKSYPSFFNDLKLVGIQIQDSKKSN